MKKILVLLYFICAGFTGIGQTADFTYQSTSGLYCMPASIRFTKITTGNPVGYMWTFGNNSVSNSANPVTTYNSAGTYTVRLIVIYKKSTLTVFKTIVVNPAVAAHFEYDRNNICTPGSINFRADPLQNIAAYEWNFGDNTGILSTTSAAISHHFSEFGTYPISLKMIAASGCYGQSFTSINVQRPSISATVSPVSGCIPATVSFNATVGLTSPAAVNGYTWNFADGSPPITTIVPHTTHTYHTVGNYVPTVSMQTNEGCSNNFILQQISFGNPPTNHIAYPKRQVFCGSESPFFVSKATNANKYFWDFGNGDTTSVTDTIIQHRFRSLGTKTIRVTPLYNDCPGTAISFTVDVIGVIAGYDYSNTCTEKKRFSFTNTIQGNQSNILWDFGDGSVQLLTHDVIHSYPDTGTFSTRLSVTDSITGCSDSYFTDIYTANPILTNNDTSICKNSNTNFHIKQNYNNPDIFYYWHVAGMQPDSNKIMPFTRQAKVHGIFHNNFVIIGNGPQYCPDTIALNNRIIVRGPVPDFTATTDQCVGQEYNITNNSRPYFTTDIIHIWDWSYGITGHTDNAFQPLPYVFPYWGTFKIKLTATDINGCSDTLVKPVVAHDIPFLYSIHDVDTLCSGQSAKFTAFHNDPITWTPSNSLSCATCDTVLATPQVTTTYYIKATDRFNCTATDSISIIVYSPFTASAKKTDNYICVNESVQLEIRPGSKKISWQPVTGLSGSNITNPIASPKQNTLYTATLTDSAGCFSSTTQVNLYVKSLPTVNAGPDKTYPYQTNYSFAPVYSRNVNSYTWEPSTLLSCSNCAFPTGMATSSQTYLLRVTSDSGCVATDKISAFVECKGVNILFPTAFTPNRDYLNDYYYPITRGIKKIIRFSIYNRQGELVFEGKDFMPNNKLLGWDGNFKGMPQTPAAYVYTLEAVCEVGEMLHSKGSFLLVR